MTLAMIVVLLSQAGGHRIIADRGADRVTSSHGLLIRWSRSARWARMCRRSPDGLRSGAGQDPDAILVGEIRDRETAQMALSAAETGHLLCSRRCIPATPERARSASVTDLFPQEVRPGHCTCKLAMSLRAVVSQRLLPGTERRRPAPGPGGVVQHQSGSERACAAGGKIESLDTPSCWPGRRVEASPASTSRSGAAAGGQDQQGGGGTECARDGGVVSVTRSYSARCTLPPLIRGTTLGVNGQNIVRFLEARSAPPTCKSRNGRFGRRRAVRGCGRSSRAHPSRR